MDEKKKVINTTEEVNRDPLSMLAESVVMGSSAAIHRQEAQGQKSFVESDTLPTEGPFYNKEPEKNKKILESFGFKLLGPVPGDSLFQFVELPTGWKKVASDHPMHSNIVDEKGRERIHIFYKAAFYDRNAFFSINRRYTVEQDWIKAKEDIALFHVRDAGKIIFSTREDGRKPYYEIIERLNHEAKQWVTEHYPNWEDPGAYWGNE